MSRILVIGATSAIAERACRIWAGRQSSLYVVGRDCEKVAQVAADLRVRGAAAVEPASFEALAVGDLEALVSAAWHWRGGFDVVLLAHGSLPDSTLSGPEVDAVLKEFAVNATSMVALMTLVAVRLETQGSGVLAVVSSVAGDRGRASTGVYGAAKAAVTAYASGLRQRLAARGVKVVTIKPGFVDTPMTQAFEKGTLWATPEAVAADIVRAIDRQRPVIYTPWFWRWIMLVVRLIPERLFLRLKF